MADSSTVAAAPGPFRNGVEDQPAQSRFVMAEAGHQAFADYRQDGGRLIIPHVEADRALRGTGAAGRLMEGVVDALRQRQLKVVPLCAYAAGWFRRHPEHADLVEERGF